MEIVAQELDDQDMPARTTRYSAARDAATADVIYVPALKRYARASIQSAAVRYRLG